MGVDEPWQQRRVAQVDDRDAGRHRPRRLDRENPMAVHDDLDGADKGVAKPVETTSCTYGEQHGPTMPARTPLYKRMGTTHRGARDLCSNNGTSSGGGLMQRTASECVTAGSRCRYRPSFGDPAADDSEHHETAGLC